MNRGLASNANTGDLTVSSVISGATFGVTKQLPGTLVLTAADAYTGATTISEGNLRVEGSLNASSAVTVNAGGTLSGTGTVNGTLNVNGPSASAAGGGTVAPGDANIGILTVVGNTTFAAGARLSVRITPTTAGGTVAGTDYDQLVVNGTLSITPGAAPTLSVVTGASNDNATNGSQFAIISRPAAAAAIAGNFGNAANGGLVDVGGKLYTAAYNTGAASPNLLVLTATAHIGANALVWDGLSAVSNNWTDAANWVGDGVNDRPFAGDSLVFDDTGVQARNTPFDDFAAGTNFGVITLNTTLGSYTLKGNGVLLNAASGGVTNTQGVNTITLPLSTAANPQTITATAGTLNLNGAVTLGAGGGLNLTGAGNVVFGSTIDARRP